jgi:hypothetical protein
MGQFTEEALVRVWGRKEFMQHMPPVLLREEPVPRRLVLKEDMLTEKGQILGRDIQFWLPSLTLHFEHLLFGWVCSERTCDLLYPDGICYAGGLNADLEPDGLGSVFEANGQLIGTGTWKAGVLNGDSVSSLVGYRGRKLPAARPTSPPATISVDPCVAQGLQMLSPNDIIFMTERSLEGSRRLLKGQLKSGLPIILQHLPLTSTTNIETVFSMLSHMCIEQEGCAQLLLPMGALIEPHRLVLVWPWTEQGSLEGYIRRKRAKETHRSQPSSTLMARYNPGRRGQSFISRFISKDHKLVEDATPTLPLEQQIRFCIDCATAVVRLHTQGHVAHGNIRASRVMVDGDEMGAKLVAFAEMGSRQKSPAQRPGAPPPSLWIAPEYQLEGEDPSSFPSEYDDSAPGVSSCSGDGSRWACCFTASPRALCPGVISTMAQSVIISDRVFGLNFPAGSISNSEH